MAAAINKAAIISGLKTDILRLQGFKTVVSQGSVMGLDFMSEAFPQGVFPIGAVHEFLSGSAEDNASISGFISGLLSTTAGANGTFLWISPTKKVFPPALKNFSLQPDHFIFIKLHNDKEMMWVMEEALKCAALSAVICESRDLTFTQSRRLQLAVEKSAVTGFVIRRNPKKLNATACVSRWRITSMASNGFDGLPGVGFPKWKIELLKIRNGKPGTWEAEWRGGRFRTSQAMQTEIHHQKLKAG
jgi:protein ImuA